MNPVAEAAEQVAAQNRDPKSDPDPDPAGSADPDPGADAADVEQAIPAAEAVQEETVQDRLWSPLEGSIREDRIDELWDPEQGGLNRLVLVGEELAGMSDGLPRLFHVPLGLAEAYVQHADGLDLGGNGQDEQQDELVFSEEDLR